ncbi:MAG: hypothetical protein R3F30_13030 [Planctomycetota bacterium]
MIGRVAAGGGVARDQPRGQRGVAQGVGPREAQDRRGRRPERQVGDAGAEADRGQGLARRSPVLLGVEQVDADVEGAGADSLDLDP